jgi:hypothetical protein
LNIWRFAPKNQQNISLFESGNAYPRFALI